MKPIKIFLSIIGALLLILVIFLVMQYYQKRDINFQMEKLSRGTTQEKSEAIEFIGEIKAYGKIPVIMEYIDSYESYLYLGKDPTRLTCDVTLVLGKLTGLQYGNTCDSDNSKTPEEEEKIRQSWKDWYKTEYPKWIKEQTK